MQTRVFHIVEALGRGATETWLLRMLSHANAKGASVDWTFYCALPDPGPETARALSLGAKVITSPVPVDRKVAFFRALRGELKTGKYDVVHSHHDLVSGFYLAAALAVPLRRRVVHVHNAGEAVPTASRLKQLVYKPLLRGASLALADRIVGVSNHTLDTFLGGRVRRYDRDLVHYCGVDASPFAGPAPDRGEFRRGLGLREDVNIMLFAGRLVPEKNPVFAVDVLAELRRLDPRAVAVFAGSGSEEGAILKRAKAIGLVDHIRLLGWRDDVPSIMRCADWFILPSPEWPKEGFGLAVVEAQLAGLRLLISTGILDEPLLENASYRRLSLTEPAAAWAAAAADMMTDMPPSPAAACKALAASPLNMEQALTSLLELHR
jgi:glycosyltransferase involved in cell wall biosynthesis